MRRRGLLLALPACFLLLACGEEEGRNNVSAPTDDSVAMRGGEGRPCLLDADCATGYGCVIGVCTEGCTNDDDCDGGHCDPHGYCGGPAASGFGPLVSAEPVVTVPELGIAPGKTFDLTVENPSGDPLVARIAFPEGVAEVDGGIFVVEPGGSTSIAVTIADGLVASSAAGTLWTDHGTQTVPVLLSGELSGTWRGQVTFDDGRPLGRSSLGLDLEFDTNGSVVGHTVADASVMWPVDTRAAGQWDEVSDKVTLELHDVIPALAGAADELESPLGREVERRVFLNGRLSADGQAIEGEVRESLVGLRETQIIVTGSFRLRRTGALAGPLALPPVVASPGTPDPWPTAAEDPCDGVGTTFATPGDIGADEAADCETCALGPCTENMRQACVDALSGFGYQVEQTITFGDIEVSYDGQFAEPQGWASCFGAASQNYPCIDEQSLRCASRLRRDGWADAPNDMTARAMLDALESELTSASLIGAGHMVDAGLAYTENTPLDVAQAELASLHAAREAFTQPARFAVAPEMLVAMDSLGLQVLRDERGGRDLATSLAVAARRVEVDVAALRLQRRAEPGLLDELRVAASWDAVWFHAWGAMLSDLFDAYAVQDEMGQLAVFDEGIGALDVLWRELQPGTNPLGFSPDHVPILLSKQDGMGTVSNYELLANEAEGGIAYFEKSVTNAKHALDSYEKNAYDAEQRASAVREQFDAQLIALCGAKSADVTQPNLEACGSNSGEIQTLLQRIEAAGIRVEQAHAGMTRNQLAIEVERERMAKRIENAEDLEITLDGLEDQLMVIVGDDAKRRSVLAGTRARSQCSAIKETAMVDSMAAVQKGVLEMAAAAPKLQQGIAGAGQWVVDAIAINQKSNIQCRSTMAQAGYDAQSTLEDALSRKKTMLVNQEINAAVRASQINDQIIDSEATVKRMALDNELLALDIDAASQDMVIAATQLANAYEQAASLLARRERALDRLTFDPSNPYLNPSFLLVRNELGRRLASDRERALRQTYRAGRALEYEINRNVPTIESRLFPSRAPTELQDVNTCLGEIFVRHQLAYGSPQQHVTELSLRRDIFGINGPVPDPGGGGDVSETEQFQALLTQPAHVLPDGSIEITITMPIEGAGAQTSSLLCNDRIETLQVEAVGDFLGDEQMVVMIGRKGGSHVRRCDAESLPEGERVSTYTLDERRVAIQAGVNDWGTAPANAGLAGWPVAGDQWVFTVPSGVVSPENADADLARLSDFLFRITHRAGTVAEEGSVPFTPSCG